MENNDFTALAALYSLGMLAEPESHSFAAQLTETPELGEEVKAYKAAFAALAYDAPIAPLPARLKQHLFAELDQSVPSVPLGPLAEDLLLTTPMSVKQLTQLRWKSYQVPGVEVARLHIDKQKRQVAYLMRAEAGVCLPVHRHAEVEEILILEGDLWVDQQVYAQGDYLCSLAGSAHSPHTVGGCLAFVRTSLDDEWLT